jgi:hypothetical protein
MSIRLIPLGVLVLLAGGALGGEPPAQATRQEVRGQCATVTGSVAAVGPDLVVIRGAGSQPVPLEVGPDVRVTVGGRPASRDALTPGMEVRATYEVLDGQPTAVSLDAESPSRPGPPPAEEELRPSPPPRTESPASPQGQFQPSPMETPPPPPPDLGPPAPLPLP